MNRRGSVSGSRFLTDRQRTTSTTVPGRGKLNPRPARAVNPLSVFIRRDADAASSALGMTENANVC